MKALWLSLVLAFGFVGCVVDDEPTNEELLEDWLEDQEQDPPLDEYAIEAWCSDLMRCGVIFQPTEEELLSGDDGGRYDEVKAKCEKDMATKAAVDYAWADCMDRKRFLICDDIEMAWDECNAGDYE
jgi:hypothetical protein